MSLGSTPSMSSISRVVTCLATHITCIHSYQALTSMIPPTLFACEDSLTTQSSSLSLRVKTPYPCRTLELECLKNFDQSTFDKIENLHNFWTLSMKSTSISLCLLRIHGLLDVSPKCEFFEALNLEFCVLSIEFW